MLSRQFLFVSAGLLVCCSLVSSGLAAEDASVQREEALRLLQSAATQSAIGKNQGAEELCRKLLESPALLKHVDVVQVRLLLASVLKEQKRNQEAYDLLLATLKEQRERLGEDHPDIADTMQAFGGLVIDLTWPTAIRTDLPKEEAAEATALAREAASLGIPHGHWSLALLLLRQGDKASLDSITRSLGNERDQWLGQFSILAMALAQNGNYQLARDAYAVVCDRGAKEPSLWSPIQKVHDQASDSLKLTTQRVLDEMSRVDLVEAYSRLIEAYPGVARLHAWRASHLQCLKRFKEAEADLQKSTEIRPDNWRVAEALTAVRLMTASGNERAKICKDFMDACLVDMKYGRLSDGGPKMDLVLLCSLAGDADIDREKILESAEEILKTTPTRPFLELGRGMALYRVGRYEEALNTLPGADAADSGGKDRGLPIIFRAMALQQLGEKRAAKAHLKDAEEYVGTLFGGDRVARMRYQDAGTHYCLLAMGLKEARALIGAEKE